MNLTDTEKRTILLSWAKDELALEQVAAKVMPEFKARSRISAVINALSQFDPLAAEEYLGARSAIRGRPDGCRRRRKERAH